MFSEEKSKIIRNTKRNIYLQKKRQQVIDKLRLIIKK